jgi:hypothetical protein
MMKSTFPPARLAFVLALGARLAVAEPAPNIAPLATVTASARSETAPRAVDGGVPAAGSRDSANQIWDVKKADLPASLVFAWEKPQAVRTLVYYGKTSWGLDCFKDYEVYLDDAPEAVVTGAFQQGHGPQRVDLPVGSRAARLTLKLLSSEGGNPGASEVQVFGAPPEQSDMLCRFTVYSFDFRYAYYPSHNLVRVLAPTPPADAKTWHVAVRAKDSDKILAERSGDLPMSPNAEALALPELPEGNYTATLTLSGGKEPVIEERGFSRNRYEWEGPKLGLDDVVIPPFTPLVADPAKQTVESVLRQHRHGAAGLWEQVTSRDVDLLAAPVRLEATIGGKTVVVTGDTPQFTERKDTRVAGTADWAAGALKGNTTFDYDYDGFMQLALRLNQSDTEIERLQLVIPMKAEHAWLIHPVTTQLRHHYAGRLPALSPVEGPDGTPSTGSGPASKVWDSSKVTARIAGYFVPYMYLGGPERGICFAADNDRDWVRGADVPMMEIDRVGEVVNLRLNLIGAPTKLTRERILRFALQATPAKPMPVAPYNWRRWWATRTAKDIDDVQIGFWGGNMYWGGLNFATSVFPTDKDFGHWAKLAEQRRTGKVDKAYLEQWLAKLPANKRAEVSPAMKAGFEWSSFTSAVTPETTKYTYLIPYTNPRGANVGEDRDFATTYIDEWQTIDITDPNWLKENPFNRVKRIKGFATWYHVEPVPSRVDMMLYYHKKMFETFADGVYWDNMFLRDSRIPVEAGGPAYVDDAGQLQPGVNLMAFRNLVRRTAVMMHVMGKRSLTFIHMTNVNMVPMLSFGTLNLDWEWRDQGHWASKDLQDRMNPDLILAQSLGLQAGNVSVGITANILKGGGGGVSREWLNRTAMAVCFPHEIKIYQGTPEVTFVQEQLAKFGYGQEDCKVHRYWEPGFPLKAEGANIRALVLSRGGKALIAVGNYGPRQASDTGGATTATQGDSLEDYDAVQRGLKKPETEKQAADEGVKAETYTVRMKLDLATLGLLENAQAHDVELKAGKTKTENLCAIKKPTVAANMKMKGDTEALDLKLKEEGDGSLLKRIAPGLFELQITTHDFVLIEVGQQP